MNETAPRVRSTADPRMGRPSRSRLESVPNADPRVAPVRPDEDDVEPRVTPEGRDEDDEAEPREMAEPLVFEPAGARR
jgi:hypothetical protein